ncbi:hypothetical protein Q0F98_03395 [Paenibacillus amylolyticus]|nr:hypothetical protein Q0F98_03395 [Paenibacillus amylolyticus]
MMLRKVLGKGSIQVVVLLVMVLNLIPLIIAFSTSLRDPSNNTNPLVLFRRCPLQVTRLPSTACTFRKHYGTAWC